jgi:hypothetical protein
VRDDRGPDVGTYCREIEAYLCRRNGGHLIRIVGPAFELVTGWHQQGVPLRVVFQGIDRRVERQGARGGRVRAVRIEFCDADVLEAFDEWKRAVGTLARRGTSAAAGEPEESGVSRRGPSLPEHLERVQRRITSILAGQRLPGDLSACLTQLADRLEVLHSQARTARGAQRQRILAALVDGDRELAAAVVATADAALRGQARDQAAADLGSFRARMAPGAWEASVEAAATRLLCERLGLPTLVLD